MKTPANQVAIWRQPPRALREAGNGQILERLRLAQATVDLLAHDGHLVVDLLITGDIVTIIIAPSERLAQLVEQGKGYYFLSGVDRHGLRFRNGVLTDFRNASVIWTERGH